jgi:PAS domain S-box-containing protein
MGVNSSAEAVIEKSTAEQVAVSESEALLALQAAALKAAANAIIITDYKATIVWVNPAFEQLTGYLSQEVIGQSTRLLKSGQHAPPFYKNLWDTILSGKKWQGNLSNRRKDGTLYAEEMTITRFETTPERSQTSLPSSRTLLSANMRNRRFCSRPLCWGHRRRPALTAFWPWTRRTRSSCRTSRSRSCGVCRQR